MTRAWLRSLNAPLLLLVVGWGMAVLSSLISTSSLEILKPNLTVVLALYVALRRSFAEGGILALGFGYLEELHSSIPRGAGLMISVSVFLFIHLLRRNVLIPSDRPPLWVFPVSTILGKIVLFSLFRFLSIPHLDWVPLILFMGPSVLIDAIFGIWVFKMLKRFDWHTFKDDRAVQAYDGERVLDSEEL